MRLGDLWAEHGDGTPLPGSATTDDLFILDVTDDSRDVRFGSLFCAVPGTSSNGVTFCAQAAAKGAQAVAIPSGTSEKCLGLSEYERLKIVVLHVPNVREFHAKVAAQFHPGRPQLIAAVTGTNGKTSTVSFLRDLWAENDHVALSLGTLGLRSRDRIYTNLEAGLTTFDAKTLHMMLGELARAHNVSHLAMEASSHALDQDRLSGLSFEAAGFTNLTQDHLDYHVTMDAYFASKRRLFSDRLSPNGLAVINAHDGCGQPLIDCAKKRGNRVISYGEHNDAADLRLVSRTPHERGQTLVVSLFGSNYEIECPLAGIFQAENILCALGLAIGTGVPTETAVSGASRLAPVPGRLERAAILPNGAVAYVDYAHTPDALDNVLRSLRPHVGDAGRLHVVFGCGGDRDPKKRPIMGAIAAKRAEKVWVTDDNPRTEDAAAIRLQVLDQSPGAIDAGSRRDAINRALSDLRPGDILVVAGKGHEDYQILPKYDPSGVIIREPNGRPKTFKTPFSDLVLIREATGQTQI